MKEIGILTVHRACNYGALFQAFALYSAIKDKAEVKIIDYLAKSTEERYNPFRIDRGKSKPVATIKMILNFYSCVKRKKLFGDFIKKYIETTESLSYDKLHLLDDRFDLFISGSDQIWNYVITQNDAAFFLNFVTDQNKKYSYAASFGNTIIPNEIADIYRYHLNDYGKISVREKSAQLLVKKLIDRDCVISVDPVFLINKDKWLSISQKPKIKKKYIIIYEMLESINMINFAKKMAREKNLDLFILEDRIYKYKDIKHIIAPTPEKFLGWLSEAEYVISNSFHGTAFSIIFEKDFFIEVENKFMRNVRSEELLRALGLESRMIDGHKNNNNVINWITVNQRLKEMITSSDEYIEQIVNS